MHIGKTIRRLRIASHIEQQELARQAGTTAGHLCSVERGKRPLGSLDLLERIARALDVEVSQLYAAFELDRKADATP